jgi:endonuclease YncB( thermonuclease family)
VNVLTAFAEWPAALTYGYGPYRAVVQRVVDGDTLVALVDFGFREYRLAPVRLLCADGSGVNAPESNRPASRAAGLAAKAFTESLCPAGAPVLLRTRRDPDAFDRYLAAVTLADGTDLGGALLAAGHAERWHP